MTSGAALRPLGAFLFGAALVCGQPADSKSCPNTLCRILQYGRLPDLRWPDFADYRSRLTQFYAPSYSPAWLLEGKPSPQSLVMIALLKAADQEGLKPEDYDAGLWDERIAHLDRSQFDVGLTVALMRYLADLHYGKANPGFYHLDPKQRDFDIPSFLRSKLLPAPDPGSLIAAEVEPPFEGYKRTRKALTGYLVMARQPDVRLSELGATVEPDQPYAESQILAQRLRQLGELPPENMPPAIASSFSGPLVEALRHFQARHGIEPDGRLGKASIEQLNVPLSQRLVQLRLSMERWRWLPHKFSRPPVLVNIPEFTLRTLNAALETDLEMRVVVGSAYENQTPVFAADLTHITFRPYWNVPRSILVNEMVSKMADDRDYLKTRRYQVVNFADKPVLTEAVLTDGVLKGLVSGRYRVRQLPGAGNALGLIRFGIPNEHNVYLHGTPSQALFAKTRRDYSHGCVRVERPVELAQWCLRGTGNWPPGRILRAMRGPRTFQVNLKKPIPVLLVYATAIVLSGGEVRFTPDIYRQDALLENRLAQGYPSRATSP